eukprot:CAMPEP_0175885108 /NCGR_PEP_ID=MMETSP0107_2-20121207/44883_1 /TAXON_ID=195067 ORGANISM="Goniomonas pacifica, Strain CCMP1869" /NCGR_SAMPLE_ID=MMETSP0107_2 /ASSEMBLY_ACC=CAM_ASM_000203 /LENGTH=144 /DNA_ID=CAMNT_0017205313 /DNA_START=420 /DNA_END=854 /DNA_ORIENTATION=+
MSSSWSLLRTDTVRHCHPSQLQLKRRRHPNTTSALSPSFAETSLSSLSRSHVIPPHVTLASSLSPHVTSKSPHTTSDSPAPGFSRLIEVEPSSATCLQGLTSCFVSLAAAPLARCTSPRPRIRHGVPDEPTPSLRDLELHRRES